MKKILPCIPFLAGMLSLILFPSACVDEPLAEERLVIEDLSEIVADADGGEYVISYSIENFASKGSVRAESPADWIGAIYCGEYGKISFIVDKNDSRQTRQSAIVIDYPLTGDSYSVNVIQPADNGTGPVLALLSGDSLSVPVLGGSYDIDYVLLNAPEGETVSATPSESWIGSVSVGKESVSVIVEPNISQEPRSAVLKIEYGSALPLEVAVEQSSLTSERLDISIDSLGVRAVKVSVRPSDPIYMTYVTWVDSKQYIDGLGSDYDIFMDDLALIQQYASSYGLTMTETMWMFLKQGNWDGIYDNLTPDSEYYCYAYGVTDSLEYLTVVCKKDFRTLAIQKVDCTFDLSVDAGHDSATLTVTPSDANVAYMAGLIDPDDFFGAYGSFSNESMQLLLNDILESLMSQGITPQDYVENYTFKGRRELPPYEDLEPETKYMIYCVGLDANAEMITDAANLLFDTDEDPTIPPLTFEFDATDIRDRSITATVTPSDTVTSYCWNLVTADMTEEDIIAGMQADADLYIGFGVVSDLAGYVEMYLAVEGTRTRTFDNLVPDTDYKFYAVQLSSSGEFSQPMVFSGIITTTGSVVADCTAEVVYGNYYDGADLAAMYPDTFKGREGYAILPAYVKTEGNAVEYRYAMVEAEWADPSLHSDNDVIEYLAVYGFKFPYNYFFVTWDFEFAVISVAIDAQGNYGPVSRKTDILHKDGVSDPDEFEFF